MAELELVGCDQENCPVLTDGRCLESFDNPAGSCPHAKTRAVPASPEEDEAASLPKDPMSEARAEPLPEVDPEPNRVYVGGLSLLSESEATSILAQCQGSVVVLAAEAESGKTTLLAALYERFLHGPFGGWEFRDSATLMAFEERAFLARARCRGKQTKTPRTELEDPTQYLLHLSLVSVDDGRQHELLMADLPGEYFRRIRDGAPAATAVPILTRADVIAVMLDGAALATMEARQVVRGRVNALIAGLEATGDLPPTARRILLVAKDDELAQADESIRSWAEEKVRELALAPWEVMHVAARPSDTSTVADGHGLDAFLERLVAAPVRDVTPISLPEPQSGTREYLRFRQ